MRTIVPAFITAIRSLIPSTSGSSEEIIRIATPCPASSLGASAAEYRFAQYEEDWRVKVERLGTLNYPAEARGKLYGNLRLTVTIRPDGSVESIELDRSSGLQVLDAAAFKIVRMAMPFAVFPPNIRRDTDLLVITRTWFFGQGDKIWTE